MRMTIWTALILALPLTQGCKTADGGSTTASVEDGAPETPEAGGASPAPVEQLFVGCVPTLGECRYSCAERDGQGLEDPTLCPDELAPVACRCPGRTFTPPTPPDETEYGMVGCVPSASECRYSCPSRQIITFQGSPNCEHLDFACYCKFSADLK